MKTSKIITTTSLVALLSSFGLMACGGAEVEPADQTKTAGLTQPATTPGTTPAPDAMKPEARNAHGGRGPGGHRFGPPTPEKMLERFDANKNGALEAAELPERMQEHIGEIDTSGDGVVSKDELAAHFKAKFAEHSAKFAEHVKARFDKKDANHDGVLDQAEVGAERWARMSVADANGDQKLSPDELKSAFEAGKLKPMMRGEHGDRGDRVEPAHQ
jgi:EF hand